MAAAAKTKAVKPKASTKAKAAPKAKPAAKEKASKPIIALAVGAFAAFTGYKIDVPKDEQVFKDGDLVYIIAVIEDEETGLTYEAIPVDQIAAYQEDGEDAVAGGVVAPQEVAPLKATALEKAQEQFLPVALIGRLEEMFAEHDGNAIDVARDLNDTIASSFFWLGGALARVLQNGDHLDENGGDYAGETAFEDFCRAEFDFGASKGRQLARLYTTFSKLPDFDVERLGQFKWSLLARAERFVTAENVDEALDIVAASTQKTVDDNLKKAFATSTNVTASGKAASRGTPGTTIVKTSLSFRMEESSAETIQLAIKQCMSEHGIESPELALERICLEWAQANVSSDAAKKRIEAKQRKAEAVRTKAAAPAAEPKAKPSATTARAAKAVAAKRKAA